MRRDVGRSQRAGRGFTLIELLVVVAIIALLISILLPSLSRARAQARTTVCASRIAQIAKAFLMYADGYDETPPFTAYGRGVDANDPLAASPINTTGFAYDTENWMTGPADLAIMWDGSQEDPNWPSDWAQTGLLITYTRFQSLYRCPDFERVSDPLCLQNEFNYSRASLGRRGYLDPDQITNPDCLTPYGIGTYGPIVKPSQAYATSKLPIALDEDWRGYIGFHGTMQFSWCGCDPIMDLVDQYVGDYHSVPVDGVLYNGEWVWAGRKSGNVAMYDGHVELVRDWFPTTHFGTGGRPIPDFFGLGGKVIAAYIEMLGQFSYAQQGQATFPLEY